MIEEIIKRYKALKSRGTWENNWQEISDYVLPRKAEVTVKRAKGEKRNSSVYDSTAIHSNELLGASLQGTLTNPASQWFGLRLRDNALDEDHDVQRWLSDSSLRMYRAFSESNFNSEIHECYLDLGSVGTGCLLVEEDEVKRSGFNGLYFKSFFIADVYLDEGPNGYVDTLYRDVRYTARQAVTRWGDKAGENIKKIYEKNPDEEVEIVHAVFPSKEKGGISKKQFASVWIDVKHRHEIYKGGYDEFPYMVPRWNKASGEKYGRSPSFTALPDIRTLNRAVELELKAWAKDIDPPLLVPDEGISGPFKMINGALNYVRPDLIDKIKPVESGHRYDVSQLKLEDLRQSIRRIYFADQLQLQDTPTMTATEVQVRYELMQRLLGPTLGRLESELLSPMIERCFNLMLRSGAFLEPPETLQDADIDVEYVGPLARAQRFGEVTAVQNWLQMVAAMSEIDPSVTDIPDLDGIARNMASLLGVPPNLQRSIEQVTEKREARNAAASEEMQNQDTMAAIEGVAKLGKQNIR